MESKTLKQIENINNSLKWVKDFKPEDYPQRFLQLVEERRKLRILENAERNNPGIAAFGQSQVGKSYLMNCILQNNDTPFLVKSPKGEHNFVDEINPIGGGAEATGVVTRFSSYSRNPDAYISKLPIRLRVLKVYDILLIICSSYFNQFTDYSMDGETEINNFCESLQQKYSSSTNNYKVIAPDDILEMQLYFKQFINNAQIFYTKTPFFETLAAVIEKIPVSDYLEVFSILWHKETELTKLFGKCLNILQRLNFQEYVYLPIESVLHGGTKPDTIMSVSCLELLFRDNESDYKTEVYVDADNKLGDFTKSEICTICSEVIIHIDKKFLSSSGQYDFRDIRDECRIKLPTSEISMSLLENNDLLDFPGARPPEQGKLETLKSNIQTLMYSFLRGKVEYLFNKYNHEQGINILLYCHHQKNNDATQMCWLLDKWVKDYVGDTPEKRAKIITMTEVSPLFHIGTMFNTDMKPSDNESVGDSEKAILDRWRGRFKDILLSKCFHEQDVEWVNNWTGKGVPFQNCYMLRDYKFSKELYKGYDTSGKEETMLLTRKYYECMRQTFIKSNEVYRLFQDAALSWDTAASIGNDGSLYIIQQLSKVASKMLTTRDIQIKERLQSVADRVTDIMDDYYVSDDTSVILDQNIQKADEIFTEMDFTCQKNPEYFGHLLARLQISEPECFKMLHNLIPQLPSIVNNPSSDYELIRKRCKNFEGCKTDLDKWNCLLNVYHFESQEKAEDFLAKKGVDYTKLFKGEFIKRTNSAVISDEIFKSWKKRFDEPVFKNSMSGQGKMDDEKLNKLTQCLVGAAIFLNLAQRIEKEISPYTDILDTNSMNEYLIADVISSLISSFVMDFGYSYLSDEQVANVKSIAAKRSLPCYNYMEKERQESYDEEQTTTLFNDILSLSDCFTPAYEANYNTWLEYMYVAFVANITVPDYDEQANNELKTLLDEIKS